MLLQNSLPNSNSKVSILILIIVVLLLSGCSTVQDGPPAYSIDASQIPNAVPRVLPRSKYGNPPSYSVYGKTYHLRRSSYGYHERGIASWYGTKFNGQRTSSGETYNMLAMTAANKTLPIPCFVRVTNLENGKTIIVKVNDRGPFAPNRIIDLSYVAAKKIDMTQKGTALVDVTSIDPRTNWQKQTAPIVSKQPKLYLQIAAFKSKANAEKLKNKLAALTSEPVFIQSGWSYLLPIYRVQVGPLKGVGDADYLKNIFNSAGYQAITKIY